VYLGPSTTACLAFPGAHAKPARVVKSVIRAEATLGPIPILELSTERTSSWSCVISVSGELDRASVPALREVVAAEVANDRIRQLVLDLEDVEFVDAGGLRLLLDASEAMRKDGRRFCVVCTNPHVLRMFTLTDVRLNVVRSRESALGGAAA